MKPKINRMTYCIGCKRPKMLFEEKKKADNFIRYNKDEILEETGKAPVRSYYCAFCSGWHVTSNPSLEHGEEQDKRDMVLIEKAISIKRDISSLTTAIRQKITDIKVAIYLSDDDYDIFKEYEYCRHLLPELMRISSKAARTKLLKQIYMLSDVISAIADIKLMDLPKLKTYIETLSPSSEKVILIKRYTLKRLVNLSLIEAIDLYESGDLNQANEIKEELHLMLKEVEGIYRKKFISKCRNTINEVFYQISFSAQKEKSNLLLNKYKDKLLLLINNLERINEEFENLNFSVCKKLVEDGLSKLASMPKDSNIDLVLQHYVKWKNTLSRI